PESRHEMPADTIWPLVTALGSAILFLGVIFTPWAFVVGLICVGLPLIGWGWSGLTTPRNELAQ
ncbi:MAG TPA: hypothetical protein VG817_10555, partial [Gemmatimonadales bacterium]|nr:hypothetical protein [Gemmatimonadales bacterium]